MPKLETTLTANTAPMEAGFAKAEAVAARFGPRITARLNAQRAGQINQIDQWLAKLPAESLMRTKLMSQRESLVKLMEPVGAAAANGASKNFWANFAKNLQGQGSGGISQLVSVVSNTLSSLGSGMSPARIFMQQGPNVLQAFLSISGNLLTMLSKIAVLGGALGAIFAAPLVYLWRINAIAKSISETAILDIKTEYIARLDRVSTSWRRIAEAVKAAAQEYNSASAAAKRAMDVMDQQAKLQNELDTIAKERDTRRAAGDPVKLAAIEREYAQLAIERESARLAEQKAIKQRELLGLQKEITAKMTEAAGITTGQDDKHQELLTNMKAQYEADMKLVRESVTNQPGWFGRQMKYLGASVMSGGFIAGMANPQGGDRLTQELLAEQARVRRIDLDAAQQRIRQYQAVLNLEKARTDLIEKRKKLEDEGESKSKRAAELQLEIAAADRERMTILNNMQTVANARNRLNEQTMWLGGQRNRGGDLTENQRIGAFSTGAMLMVDLNRQQVTELKNLNVAVNKLVAKPAGVPGYGGN